MIPWWLGLWIAVGVVVTGVAWADMKDDVRDKFWSQHRIRSTVGTVLSVLFWPMTLWNNR